MPSPTSPERDASAEKVAPFSSAGARERDRFDDVPAKTARVGAHRAEKPRLRVGLIVLWSVVATFAIVIAGVFGTLFATGRLALLPNGSPSADSQIVAPEIDTSHPVQVLNATDEEGLGSTVRDDVIAAGWAAADVQESNASSTDFPTTTVYYGSEADEAAARGLADAIGGAEVALDDTNQVVPPAETGAAGGETASQLVIIVGLDFGTE